MDDLTQQLMQQLSGNGLSQISQQIGADEATTASALSTAMPLLLSALAKNASKPEGAESLHNALAKDHDGSILGNLPGLLSDPQAANGAGILGHILGNQQPTVTEGLALGTGLDNNQMGMLLQFVAPMLMGMLGKRQRQQNLSTDDLSGFLRGQQQAGQGSSPDVMGMLNNLLDSDRDGSAVNDVLGRLGKMFGGR